MCEILQWRSEVSFILQCWFCAHLWTLASLSVQEMPLFPPHLEHLVSLSCCRHGCSVVSPAWAILSTQLFWVVLLFLLSSMPRAALPLPYPTRDTPGLACVFRCFPQVRKTHRPFKGRLLQSILSLWNSNNAYSVTSHPVSCIFGQFFIHSFVSIFSNFFFSSQILEELVVLQFINYLLRHLPLIKITFQP